MNKYLLNAVATIASFVRSQNPKPNKARARALPFFRPRQIIMLPYWCKRQPGWRAEASRRRHREIMRRRRRNASRA